MDYNYNVETTLSSENFMKVNEVMLVLELFLSVNESESTSGEQNIKRVIIEMDLEEARTFITKLKGIEKEILAASQ